LRHKIKEMLVRLQLPVTRNLRYDIDTRRVMKRVLCEDSSCADIGCHEGEILDEMIEFAPRGRMYAFEPLPHLAENLRKKYSSQEVRVFEVALFDRKGTTGFNYVVEDPAYSGIRKRKYDREDVTIREINVETDLLDHLIPEEERIRFMKIDVEGAEFGVLRGAVKTIRRCRPVIIFEYGLGAADFYGTQPGDLYDFLIGTCNLRLSTLKGFLRSRTPLDRETFCYLFDTGEEYYFIAHPG
jgi:FkbM family methyltransferase